MVNLLAFLWLLIFFKINLSEIPSVSNRFDPDQPQCFVRLDLGPNCLQRLSADNTGSLAGRELIAVLHENMSSSGFTTRSSTNQAVQSQKIANGLKLWI